MSCERRRADERGPTTRAASSRSGWSPASIAHAARGVRCSARSCRPGNGSEAGLRPGHRQHGPARHGHAGALPRARLPDLRDRRLPPAEGRGARRPRDPRRRARADAWIVVTSAARAVPRRLRHDRACSPTAPARAGAQPVAARRAGGKKLPVQVIAQQWEFTYRYPDLRRRRDAAPRAAGEQSRTARHLARRDPLVLGLPARRQGRRQPRRRQRRVRQATQGPDLRSPLRRAVRDLARRHVRPRPRRHQAAVRRLDRRSSRRSSRRRPRCCRRTARPTSPNPEERRMSTTAAPAPPRHAGPLWRRLIGFNLLTGDLLGVGGYYLGWFIGHQINGGKLRILRSRHRRERRRAAARLPVRRRRLPDRARLRQLPGLAAARPPPSLRARRRTRASAATSACAPTTRSSASSTWSASACSSSSAGSTRC